MQTAAATALKVIKIKNRNMQQKKTEESVEDIEHTSNKEGCSRNQYRFGKEVG